MFLSCYLWDLRCALVASEIMKMIILCVLWLGRGRWERLLASIQQHIEDCSITNPSIASMQVLMYSDVKRFSLLRRNSTKIEIPYLLKIMCHFKSDTARTAGNQHTTTTAFTIFLHFVSPQFTLPNHWSTLSTVSPLRPHQNVCFCRQKRSAVIHDAPCISPTFKRTQEASKRDCCHHEWRERWGRVYCKARARGRVWQNPPVGRTIHVNASLLFVYEPSNWSWRKRLSHVRSNFLADVCSNIWSISLHASSCFGRIGCECWSILLVIFTLFANVTHDHVPLQ